MIFSGDLCDKVLDGTKTQTRRPARYSAEKLRVLPCQYQEGRTYAIQRKRGGHGLGPRVRVLGVTLVGSTWISSHDALAEGFASPDEFYERWKSFYGTAAPMCWRIEFACVAAGGRTVSAPLSRPQRHLLWTIAQHKYGWAHCPRGWQQRFQTAKALERRGLVTVDRSDHMPTCSATDEGRDVIARLFPVSPFILRTYDHQPGGWTPQEGARPVREAAT